MEDYAPLAALMQELLTEEGFEVAIWHPSQEPCAFVDDRPSDLILMDLRLGTDAEAAWWVIDHLALNSSTRRVPVILWSTSDHALCGRATTQLASLGVYLLKKPFDIDTLLDIIADALAASHLGHRCPTDLSPSSSPVGNKPGGWLVPGSGKCAE